MWKASLLYIQHYMIVTHKKVFTIQKSLYKSKQLSHNFERIKVKTFSKSKCSKLITLVIADNMYDQL
jgi:hypothetical protein